MDINAAIALTNATCYVYLFAEGIVDHLPIESLRLVAQASVEDIESAGDQVNAWDARPDPHDEYHTVLAADLVPAVKTFADAKWLAEWQANG